jgi:ElaB/YqjD/DUF883 family membrane-anchored ribosome-binding protein
VATNQQNFGDGGQRVGQQTELSAQGLGEMASAVKEKAQDAWDSTREGVQQAASAVADTAGNAWGDLTGFMRRYPFGTLFVGIGVGFLLAQILERRGAGRLRRMGSDLYDRARDSASDAVSRLQS